MRAVVFAGQGAQREGMGVDLFERHPEQVALADDILGFSLRALCTTEARRLIDTRYTQPALFVVAYLGYLEHEQHHGAPALLAGHSVGEFAALAAAGALDFADALRLVDSRARLMARIEDGAMAAIVGPDKAGVARLLDEFGGSDLEIANENSPTQTIVAGRSARIDALVEHCRAGGTRAVRLRVSGAFHSSQMRPAAAGFAETLRKTRFRPPRIPVIANVTARPHGSDIVEVMAAQLYRPVRWLESVEYMLDAGVTEFVEISPTPVLGPMIQEIRATPRRVPAIAAPAPKVAWPEWGELPTPLADSPWADLARGMLDAYRQPRLGPQQLIRLWRQGRALMHDIPTSTGAAVPFSALQLSSEPRLLRRQIRTGLGQLLDLAASGGLQSPVRPA